MALILNLPEGPDTPHLRPRITVVGVGGAGGNAINNMIESNLSGVDFVVANTDAQALSLSRTSRRIQLGTEVTQGLGAGAQPEIGRAAAEEAAEQLKAELQGAHMAFITAGMGGGTGTGAAPVVAKLAREMGILTVGVVTKPFQFEGAHRMRIGEGGIDELASEVDTLIIIPNQNLFHIANERTTFADAFRLADEVLYAGVRSITDLMINPGLINLDFADVRRVMQNMGRAMMGTGEAEGDRRALDAAEAAIANPLLEDTSMRGAQGVLINIIGGPDLTLYEADEAANRIREEVESDALIIVGSTLDENLSGRIRVSVVATGINAAAGQMAPPTPILQTVAPAGLHGTPIAPAYSSGFAPSATTADTRAGMIVAPAAPRQNPQTRPAAPVPPVEPAATAPAQTATQGQADHAPLLREPKSREVVKILEELVMETNSRRDVPPRDDAPPASGSASGSASMSGASGSAGFAAHPTHSVQDPGFTRTEAVAYSATSAGDYGETYEVSGMNALHTNAQIFPPPLPTRDPALRSKPMIRSHADKEPAPKAPRSGGLLGLLTGLGRSGPRETDQNRSKMIAKPLGGGPAQPAAGAENGENPEIPAFLRRQAN